MPRQALLEATAPRSILGSLSHHLVAHSHVCTPRTKVLRKSNTPLTRPRRTILAVLKTTAWFVRTLAAVPAELRLTPWHVQPLARTPSMATAAAPKARPWNAAFWDMDPHHARRRLNARHRPGVVGRNVTGNVEQHLITNVGSVARLARTAQTTRDFMEFVVRPYRTSPG